MSAICWIRLTKRSRWLVERRDQITIDDTALRLALTHLIQVIGEAARRVSSQFRERHPEILGRHRQACGVRLFMIT